MPGLNPCVASLSPICNRASRRRAPPAPTLGSCRASRHRATFSYRLWHTGHLERARGAQGVPGMPQGWSQSTPGTPSYRRRHATKPAIHAYGMPAATSGVRGPDRIPASDSRTGPYGRPPPRVPANQAQPGKAECHGSLMMTGRLRSRARTGSSVPLVPNPISGSDSRTSPRKQVVWQAATIRTHPETAESRGSQTKTSQPPNRPRPRNRTKSNLDRRSLNKSTDTTGTICESGPHHPGTAVFRVSLSHTAESLHTVFGPIPNPTSDLRISPRTPPPQRTEVAHTNLETAKYRGSRNRYKSSHRQSPTSHTDQIQSRGSISELVHDGGPHGRRSLPASSRKRLNPAVPETKTGHRAGNLDTPHGPNPISTHDSRFSPLKRPARLWSPSTITQEPGNTKAPAMRRVAYARPCAIDTLDAGNGLDSGDAASRVCLRMRNRHYHHGSGGFNGDMTGYVCLRMRDWHVDHRMWPVGE